MAKFIYKLQNILDIKLRLETQAKTEYAEKTAILRAEEDKMQKLIIQGREYEEQSRESARSRLDIPAMRRNNEFFETMKELIKQQALKIKIAERNVERAREKLNLAMQERKIHEKLKEKAFEEFKLEQNELEKKEIDELVSFRYNDNGKEMGE